MRRSFGGNREMGGGVGGGGGMLRTVQRAVRAGVGGKTPSAQDPFPNSPRKTTTTTTSKPTLKHTSNTLQISSPTTKSSSPFSPNSPTWPPYVYGDEFDWEYVYASSEDERAIGFSEDIASGSVPTNDEVQFALSSLQQVVHPASISQFVKDRYSYNSDNDIADQVTSPGVMHRVPFVGSELDWIEPSVQLCNPRMLQRHGSDRVYDAFHLLQTEPSVQVFSTRHVVPLPVTGGGALHARVVGPTRVVHLVRRLSGRTTCLIPPGMVISLSSDKAVWDAVMNNDVVREVRNSFNPVENSASESGDESADGFDPATKLLMLIFDNTKARVKELMDKIFKLVNEFFQSPYSEKTTGDTTDPFEEKLRSSFLISIMVLLIVVVTRTQKA